MPHVDNQTIQLALIAMVAVAMLVQAFVLLAAFIAMRKAARSIDDKLEAFRASITPLIDKTQSFVTRVGPKVEETADALAAFSNSLRVQSADLQSAANELIARARIQGDRLDSMFSHVLDTLDRTGSFVSDAVHKPIRQFSAILASVKAVIESLRNGAADSRAQSNRSSGDPDMFV